MILGLEPYQIVLIISLLFFAFIKVTAVTVLLGLYLAIPPRATSTQWASTPTRKMRPLSPNPMNAPAVMPPLTR